MEVTIAMLVAAIVIGITYTAYAIISRSYMDFKTKNDGIAVLNRVDQLLKRDFEQADRIVGSGNEILIDKADRARVNYEFDADVVIRKSVAIDTFKVKTGDIKITFEGVVNNQREMEESSATALADELSFTVSFQHENIPYHYHKTYSSLNLIQRNPHAIN